MIELFWGRVNVFIDIYNAGPAWKGSFRGGSHRNSGRTEVVPGGLTPRHDNTS